MKNFKKVLAVAVAAVMMSVCFASCGEEKATGIRVGGIGPITGGAAIYGQAVMNAAEMAVEEINALDSDIKFDFKMQDDEHDAEKSVNAYNTLKDWGMQILMGTVTSGPCTAVSTETNADNIFTLTPSASSTDVIGGYKDEDGNTIERKHNVFQMCFSDPNQGTASAQYISEQKLATKVAVIYNNADNYSTGIYQKFDAEAKARNLEIVSVGTCTDETTDFKTQLNAAKQAGADLVFLPIYYTPASLILKQAKDIDYAPKFFGVDGMDGILTVENFDTSLAEGVMLLTPFSADAEDEKTQNFVKNYKEKYGDVPNQFAADAYDCMYALYELCKAQGITMDMTAEEINDKLCAQITADDFTFDGLTGTGMKWSESGEVSKAPMAVVIENGEYVGM
ncbi:MAG: ABC transporter substrate-binding protein [Oscillospiraceae bacterium]|nr:ABC transporter substrate-binding protein [Oscillospiraceae bacterium]